MRRKQSRADRKRRIKTDRIGAIFTHFVHARHKCLHILYGLIAKLILRRSRTVLDDIRSINMTQTNGDVGIARRIFNGAIDLVWQDTSPARAPAQQVATAPHEAPSEAAISTPHNPMSAELLAVVMNRPTAYSGLADAISALSDIPMDEATRYRSSFAVLRKTQQRTVEQIVQAIDVHLSVLASEQARFAAQAKSAQESDVAAREDEIKSLQAAVEEGGQQIAKLRADTDALVRQIQDDLGAKQARAAQLAREVEQKSRAFAQTRVNFEQASAQVKATLDGARQKVAQYLA